MEQSTVADTGNNLCFFCKTIRGRPTILADDVPQMLAASAGNLKKAGAQAPALRAAYKGSLKTS